MINYWQTAAWKVSAAVRILLADPGAGTVEQMALVTALTQDIGMVEVASDEVVVQKAEKQMHLADLAEWVAHQPGYVAEEGHLELVQQMREVGTGWPAWLRASSVVRM